MLNSQQTAAVQYINGPLLVLAGAGSGKTRVITEKIKYLINTCGYSPQSICAVTFTNKAASEMRARVDASLPADKRRGLKIATFHTLGLTIIKANTSLCGLKPGFTIFDSDDCIQVLRSFFPSNKANDKEYMYSIQQIISLWKNALLMPEDLSPSDTGISPCHDDAARIYPQYQRTLKSYNAVDFDDLILLPVRILSLYPQVLDIWQNKIRHLLVDEYQDSNTSQYMLVKKLVGVRAQFTVVGDDDQSIYAWRGAKPENLAQLQKDYPKLKIIKLEQNYRSTNRILHTANQLISHNQHIFEKKLWSSLGLGEPLRVIQCKDEVDEAEQVITDLISHKIRYQTDYGDYAILYRGNHQSRVFEKILRQYSIPYSLSGGQSWFAKTEVKDIFAYLKILCNPEDDASFIRAVNTPKRGIGDTSLDALGQYTQAKGISLYSGSDHLALSEHLAEKPRLALQAFKAWTEEIKTRLHKGAVREELRTLVEESGYETHVYDQVDAPAKAQKKMDNVWELIDWVHRLMEKNPEHSLADVVNKLILIDILEQSDEQDKNNLQLMTLHASKGLEFPYVYLVGMEEELLPHRVSIDLDDISEERRLAYVGITRAQKGLSFTLAKQRRRAGELKNSIPSRFLDELPQENLEWFGRTTERNEEQSKKLARSHLMDLKNMLETD